MWDNVSAELGAGWPNSQHVTAGSYHLTLEERTVLSVQTAPATGHFPGHYTTQQQQVSLL